MRGREKEGNALMTHSSHFIYSYMVSDIMVKVHSDSERGNLLPPHELLFPTDMITHIIAFVTSVMEHWLKQEIAQ